MLSGRVAVLLTFVILAVAACGGGNSSVPSVPSTATPSAQPPGPTSATVQITSGTTPTIAALPNLAGYHGTIDFPGSSAAQTFTLTMSTRVPASAGARIRAVRAPDAATYQPLLYITLSAEGAASVFGTPGYTFFLPSNVSTSGSAFYVSVFTPSTPNSNFLVGPATLNADGTIAFSLNTASSLVFQSGQTYEFVLFAVPGVSPTSSPTPSGPQIREYAMPGMASSIATGPDGNLWVAIQNSSGGGFSGVARLTTSGVLSLFPEPGNASANHIVSGPHGKLWISADEIGYSSCANFDQYSEIDSITTDGTYTSYRMCNRDAAIYSLTGLTAGSDGNIWAAAFQSTRLLELNTSSGEVTAYPVATPQASPPAGPTPPPYGPQTVAMGADGALWFTVEPQFQGEPLPAEIGRMTAAGVVSYVAAPGATEPASQAPAITYNPIDGNVWFTEAQSIGRVTPAGVVSEFPVAPGTAPGYCITAAPDGSLWFMEGANLIGHMDKTGKYLGDYAIPTQDANPISITVGSDGNIWFAEQNGQKVGELVLH